MSDILELINFEEVVRLIENIGGLARVLISLFAQCVGWLGPEILITLSAGVTIAIVLRILGR